ncbi:MAG: RluA family pseudouridine synthase [Bradymonadia bacterium]
MDTPDALSPEPIVFVVDGDLVGMRLDRALAQMLPDYSRSRLAQWVKTGRVKVDGAKTKPSLALDAGVQVHIDLPPPEPTECIATPMDLDIVYEDAELVVVNKPAGVVMHPAPGHQDDTLVNGLVARYGNLSPIGGPHRPGVVHRIDAFTTGVVVVARTERAHHHLAAQFAEHTVDRRYHALVWGRQLPAMGTFDTLHGRHMNHRLKFTTRVERGRRAVTHYTALAEAHGATWVEMRLETGRTHQIRVHMAEANWPLLGDPLYGRPRRIERPTELRLLGIDLGLKRQALHAFELGFEHPVTGERLRFESTLPEDLASALEALGITP